MADLIIKFFQEDLTEAEQQVLSDSLWASEEEAMRLTEEAAKAYQRYGLPEPEWTGGGPPKKHWPKGRTNPWLWISVLLTAGLLACVLWHYRAKVVRVIPLPSWLGKSSVSEQSTGSNVSFSPKELSMTLRSKWAPNFTDPKRIVVASSEMGHPTGSAGSTSPGVEREEELNPSTLSSRMTPVLTPVDATANPHRAHSNLSVMVRRAEPGQVTLRLFDVDDQQVLLLYQGSLQPGNWAFDWDGKLGGKPAPPGYYQIQVESGAVTQRKKIFIR